MSEIKISLKLKNTEGKEVTKKLVVTNPLVKTLIAGKSYRFGHLVSLAAKGTLSEAELKESPALVGMSAAKALGMVEDAYRAGTELLAEEKKESDKAE